MSVNSRPSVRRFVDLATQIRQLPPSCGRTRLVGVDGPGGAGKSTFAGRLSAALDDATIVHTDDFASMDHPFDWWPRLLDQLIARLRHSTAGRYQRYDWVAQTLSEWHEVPAAPVVVIEGVGAARREFADALSFVIWIDTPADLRLRRGIERDGEAMRGFWSDWIDGETRHYAKDRTRGRADLIVSGDPHISHDPQTEFVQLSPTAVSRS